MNNQQLIKGLALVGIALLFGIPALGYRLGNFTQPGPGLFPLIISGILLAIGIAAVVKSRFIERVPMDFKLRNIALILFSLAGFAFLSEKINMTVGVVFLVFVSGFGAKQYSIARNIKILIGLLAIAFALQQLLGLNLHLY